MSDQGRPKVSDLVIMTVHTGQRKKVGTSRIVIKNTLVDTYGVTDDKRSMTRIRDTIKKLVDENILDPITPHSFHLTDAGLKKYASIKASEAWKRYTDKLSGKTTKSTKRQTKGSTKGKSSGSETTSSRGAKKSSTSPKTPSTPKSRSKSATQKRRRQPTVTKRQHFDAVIPKTPSASIKASEERKARLARSQQRHEEMWATAHKERRKRVSSRKAVTSSSQSNGKSSVGKKRTK